MIITTGHAHPQTAPHGVSQPITAGQESPTRLCRGRGPDPTRPDAVLADKAYASGITRKMLRRRGIKVVIPLKSDQIAARKRKGSKGGRPPGLDRQMYRLRNVVERSFADQSVAAVSSPAANSRASCWPATDVTGRFTWRSSVGLSGVVTHRRRNA